MPNTSAIERAYAAGLVDGEGCIGIRSRTARKGDRRYRVFVLVVEVNNTDHRMIEYLQTRWGGGVSHVPAPKQANRKPQWHWRLQSRQAAAFLEDILPYLVVKRQQAERGLEFQATSRNWGRGGRPPEVFAAQEQLYLQFKSLNRRGLAAA